MKIVYAMFNISQSLCSSETKVFFWKKKLCGSSGVLLLKASKQGDSNCMMNKFSFNKHFDPCTIVFVHAIKNYDHVWRASDAFIRERNSAEAILVNVVDCTLYWIWIYINFQICLENKTGLCTGGLEALGYPLSEPEKTSKAFNLNYLFECSRNKWKMKKKTSSKFGFKMQWKVYNINTGEISRAISQRFSRRGRIQQSIENINYVKENSRSFISARYSLELFF